MLVQVDDKFFDHAEVSSILPVESKTKPIAGAAFDFKSETKITLKTGETFTTVFTPQDVAAEISKTVQKRQSDDGYNYSAAIEDLLTELRRTNEHLHTMAELVTRYTLRTQ